jgi:anti-sigma B factor antagonist
MRCQRSDFAVSVQWRDRIATISVVGELDMLTAPQLRQAIADSLRRGPASLVIDLTNVRFLSCRGMRELLAARDAAGPEVPVTIAADGPATKRPLRLVGLTELIPVYATRDEAVAAVYRPRCG